MYFLIIVAAIAVYVIMTRNKFNELQQMIKNGVSDIGVQSEGCYRPKQNITVCVHRKQI